MGRSEIRSYTRLGRWISLVVAGLALLFLLTRVVLPATQRPVMRGFAAYYTAASLLRQGRLGPQVYDNAWFNRQIQAEIGQPVYEVLTPTLPTVAVLTLPLTGLPPKIARQIWIWANFVTLLCALGLLVLALYRRHPDRPQPMVWLSLVALACISPAVAANFNEDQALIFFFALFVVTLWGLITGYDGLAGLALGLALILKTTGLSLWLVFIFQRRWQALAWGAGIVGAVLALTWPGLGWQTWAAYLRVAGEVTGGASKALTPYQTTAGFFTHLFQFDARWNPTPLIDWPLLAQLGPILISGAVVALTLWWGRAAGPPLFFAGLAPLSVILLPVAEEHHFIMMLIPLFVLADDLIRQPPPDGFFSIEWANLSLAVFLLFSPIPYESPVLGQGWLALLAYPRLYGSWLLWVLAGRRLSTAKYSVNACIANSSI